MSRCPECAVQIEGSWTSCPLCAAAVLGDGSDSPLPDVPLEFSRRRLVRVLFLVSLAVIAGSFAAQLLFSRGADGIGTLRALWLGVVAMWLVVLMAVRKRHDVAKGTVYLLVLTGAICWYWDYLTGWRGWSLTYAVPVVAACSVVGLLITVRVMRTEVGDHVLYSGATVVLGLVPLVFWALGWVTDPLPSAVCGALSLGALVLLQAGRLRDVGHELAKRLHL